MPSESRSTFWMVLFALTAAQMGFGAYGVVFTKFAKDSQINPLIFCLLRDVFCVPVLFLAAYVAEGKVDHPSTWELPVFIGMGLFGIFLSQFMYILGVYYTSPDVASMFQPLSAVFTVIVAVVFRIEKFPSIFTKTGAAKISGIVGATAGAIIMSFGENSKHANNPSNNVSDGWSLFGYCALIANTLCTAIYIVMQKRYIFSVSTSRWRKFPISITAWAYFFGAIFLALTSLYYVDEPSKFHISSSGVVYTLIYAVFITSAFCYMLVTWCNMQVSSTLVSSAWPLQVFFCVIISYMVLGEIVSVIEAVGGFVIILAMLAVVWSNYQIELEKKSIGINDSDSADRVYDEEQDNLITDEDGERKQGDVIM